MIRKFLTRLLDIITPRFVTEEVALRDDGQHLVIACSMADVRPGECFDGVATMRNFNLFGMALFPVMVGEARPWPGTESSADQADALFALLAAIYAVCAPGQQPFVTLTNNPERPYGAVVADAHKTLLATGTGKTIQGLAELIRLRLPAGHGEGRQ